jgi:4'-phosphopantetheinyl transferase
VSKAAQKVTSANEVEVFLLDSDDPRCCDLENAWSLLDAEERERAMSFYLERDRVGFVAAHALLRIVLEPYAGGDPRDVRIRRSSYGWPELDGSDALDRLRFSLSRSAGLVGCAITLNADIGLDSEMVQRPAPLEIAGLYFAVSEQKLLTALPPEARDDAFYVLWTAKEAYVKARRLGLSVPLSEFEVGITQSEGSTLASLLLPSPEAETWTLKCWHYGKHCVGLAVNATIGEMRICNRKVWPEAHAAIRV